MRRTAAMSINKISHKQLGVSEPNPAWFGNGPNEASAKWDSESKNWLKSRFHFNFAEWGGGRNNFGALRVMNDDLVQPNRGFGEHPHRNAEIMTYVVRGALTHQDSMGTAETLKQGSIQYMSAASGVRHSEFNKSKELPLRFIQIWVTPRTTGGDPVYGSMKSCKQLVEARQNKLSHLASDRDNGEVDTPVKINQDMNLFVAEIDADSSVEVPVAKGRQAYLLAIEGSLALAAKDASVELEQHEAAELFDSVTVTNNNEANEDGEKPKVHLLVMEMAKA